VDAEICLKYFASDRSHMSQSNMPFPSWPILRGELSESDMNLPDYWSMDKLILPAEDKSDGGRFGNVFTLAEFIGWCAQPLNRVL
jgi:hypothetical protein